MLRRVHRHHATPEGGVHVPGCALSDVVPRRALRTLEDQVSARPRIRKEQRGERRHHTPLAALFSLVQLVLGPVQREGDDNEPRDLREAVAGKGDADHVQLAWAKPSVARVGVTPKAEGVVVVGTAATDARLRRVHQAQHRRVHRPAVSLAGRAEGAGVGDGCARVLGDDLEHVCIGLKATSWADSHVD